MVRECKVGEVGAVQVSGPSVFGGYWRMPDKTKEEFTADGWFRTGDVGHFGGKDVPDRYLTLVGRSKDLIISGGYNVYPKEIEGYIDEMDAVVESAVVGVPHSDFGEAVVAVVVADRDAGLSATAIIDALKARIANYKVPKRVFVVDDLPRNAMGKVQKNVLRERYKESFRTLAGRCCGELKPNAGRAIGTLFAPRGGIAKTASMNPVLPLV